jgi:hypothetical protein
MGHICVVRLLIGAALLTTATAAAPKIPVTIAFGKWMSAQWSTVSGANSVEVTKENSALRASDVRLHTLKLKIVWRVKELTEALNYLPPEAQRAVYQSKR